ncbi:MAG: HD domain-containing protein [Streptosporangiaceae bacterium]
MATVPTLPTTPLAVRAVEYVRACETEPVANHSLCSYLFAVLLAEHEGLRPPADFDPDLLFSACVLHDLGTSPAAAGTQRFEVDGADMAAKFLTDNGAEARGVDLVWEAIALHSSPGIAERRGTLAYLTRRGVGIDFGPGSEFITDAQGQAVHTRYPRLRMVTSLIDEIVRHAGAAPRTHPATASPANWCESAARRGTRRRSNRRR